MTNEKPLTTGEIAELCQVHLKTVLQWIYDGKLKAYRTPGNHSRAHVSDFIDFLKKNAMPIPESLLTRGNARKILIVDNDANMVSSLKRLLKKDASFEVDVAYDGFEAGIKFLLFKPDIIILDMRMPGMNGFEVAQKVKNSAGSVNTSIIVVSAYFEQSDKKRLSDIGVDACFDKPFNSDALVEQIYKLLGIPKE